MCRSKTSEYCCSFCHVNALTWSSWVLSIIQVICTKIHVSKCNKWDPLLKVGLIQSQQMAVAATSDTRLMPSQHSNCCLRCSFWIRLKSPLLWPTNESKTNTCVRSFNQETTSKTIYSNIVYPTLLNQSTNLFLKLFLNKIFLNLDFRIRQLLTSVKHFPPIFFT